MSQGPENRFIQAVHRLLPKNLHYEKMHNAYRGGTADCWYSGYNADLWIEYKWIDRVPKKGRVVPNLSPLQREWLRGRWEEGRNVLVVVGHPGGAVLYDSPAEWEDGFSEEVFTTTTMTKKELAALIVSVAA